MSENLIGKHIVHKDSSLYMGTVSAVGETGRILLAIDGKPAGCIENGLCNDYVALNNDPRGVAK